MTLFENALDKPSRTCRRAARTLEQTLHIHFRDLRNVLQPLGDRDRIASFCARLKSWLSGWTIPAASAGSSPI